MAFRPTHVVPDGGLPAWNEPDGTPEPAANLIGGTELEVRERRGDWASVGASNGWTGWVDARRLTVIGGAGAMGDSSGAAVPAGVTTSPPMRRLGAYVLDVVLAMVTLGIGWLVWSLFTFRTGQSPAKRILGMRVVHLETGSAAPWGRMFVREFVGKLIIGLVAFSTVLGLVLYLWLLWDKQRQQLWDKLVDTVVVDDPDDFLAPDATGHAGPVVG